MVKSEGKWILLIALTSYFMILMDNSIIFTGSVIIAEDLQLNILNQSWISTSYSITFGGFLILSGKLGDLLGHRFILILGLAIFTISSFFIGIAEGANLMFVFRAIQGVGAAILATNTLSLLMYYFQGEERKKVISYYGATAGLGSAVGLLIGGIFAHVLSWRYGFFLNIPIGIVMIILCRITIDNSKAQRQKIDFIGSVLSIIAMALLVYGIIESSNRLLVLGLATIFLVGFIIYESRMEIPMLPLRVFQNHERLIGFIGRFCFMGAMMAFWFFTPQFMQKQLYMSPLQCAIGFLPLTLVNFYSAMKVPSLIKRRGNYLVLIVGLSTILAGFIILVGALSVDSTYLSTIFIPMLLIGIGQGLSLSPLTILGVTDIESKDMGSASGVVNMMHQFGGAVGVAIVTNILSEYSNVLEGFRFGVFYGAGGLIFGAIAVTVSFYCLYKGRSMSLK